MIDLDDFKSINDKWGHEVGDIVLRKVGEVLNKTFRSDDLVEMCIRDSCMHPQDAPNIDAVVEAALAKGEEYEVQYRMRRRDGSYLWVNDMGRKAVSDSGREICISTIRDITDEVEHRQEIERQKEWYDRLLQSVLCGIVQYKAKDDMSCLLYTSRCV